MKTGITVLPYTQLDKQIDHAGHREFYQMQYHDAEDCCLWDERFIKTLDRYLINPTSLTHSEAKMIEAFLSHEDAHMGVTPKQSHAVQVVESLDKFFYESTLKMMGEST